MRYRIVIEVDVDENKKRSNVNELAHSMAELAVTMWSNPVFLSTEQVVSTEEIQVLRNIKRIK